MPQDDQVLLSLCHQLEGLIQQLLHRPHHPETMEEPPQYPRSLQQAKNSGSCWEPSMPTRSQATTSVTVSLLKSSCTWPRQPSNRSQVEETQGTRSVQKTTMPSKGWQHGHTMGRTSSNNKPQGQCWQWPTTSGTPNTATLPKSLEQMQWGNKDCDTRRGTKPRKKKKKKERCQTAKKNALTDQQPPAMVNYLIHL